MQFRNLRADEIEVRAHSVTGKGVSLLLYKDARCDMRILDETVGPENWQKRFYERKGTLFCSVGIIRQCYLSVSERLAEPQWVFKDDAGEASSMSAQKGEASDAFKRACVNWGIGRELYTAPFIWVPADKCRIINQRGKNVCRDRFSVAKIQIEDGIITGIRIVNDSMEGVVAFSWIRK